MLSPVSATSGWAAICAACSSVMPRMEAWVSLPVWRKVISIIFRFRLWARVNRVVNISVVRMMARMAARFLPLLFRKVRLPSTRIG